VSALLAACGGFLLAILWMDLIFDVQVLGHRRADGPLPEPVLASIAAYYKRATTDSAPMSRLIAAVWAWPWSAASTLHRRRPRRRCAPHPPRRPAPMQSSPSRGRADHRVSGSRRDVPAAPSDLARAICRHHVRAWSRSRRSVERARAVVS
jgi:hypothetical protein